METRKESESGPIMWLLGVIVVGILTLVLAATLLRKPPQTNPFDEAPTAAEPAAPPQ